MNKLKGDLKEAVEKEDYEKAASLRDEIKKLELSR
jgi:protein-arginine kinase activator protein McsA